MRLYSATPSLAALLAAGALVLQGTGALAFTSQGPSMPLDLRYCRVLPNFTGGAPCNTSDGLQGRVCP